MNQRSHWPGAKLFFMLQVLLEIQPFKPLVPQPFLACEPFKQKPHLLATPHQFVHVVSTSNKSDYSLQDCYLCQGGYIFSWVCLVSRITGKNYWPDFHDTWWNGVAWAMEEPIKFWRIRITG